MTPIDLSPLISTLIQLLSAALLGVGLWAVQRLLAKLGIDQKSALYGQLADLLQHSASFASAHCMDAFGTADFTKCNCKSTAVQVALGFINSTAPEVLKRLDITPDKVEQLVLGALGVHDPNLILPPVTSAALPAPTPAAAA
jgi:hypothetical protein